MGLGFGKWDKAWSQPYADLVCRMAEAASQSSGPGLETRSNTGMTPLLAAASVGNWAACHAFLGHRADVNVRAPANDFEPERTPLDFAVKTNWWVMDLLKKHGGYNLTARP